MTESYYFPTESLGAAETLPSQAYDEPPQLDRPPYGTDPELTMLLFSLRSVSVFVGSSTAMTKSPKALLPVGRVTFNFFFFVFPILILLVVELASEASPVSKVGFVER